MLYKLRRLTNIILVAPYAVSSPLLRSFRSSSINTVVLMTMAMSTTYAAAITVSILLGVITSASLASAACSSPPVQRSLQTVAVSANTPLVASKLYDVTVRSAIMCQSACLAETTCYAVTFNKQTGGCSLYAAGNTSYTTSGLTVYTMLQKDAKVSNMCDCE
jgi:hypothetical protein